MRKTIFFALPLLVVLFAFAFARDHSPEISHTYQLQGETVVLDFMLNKFNTDGVELVLDQQQDEETFNLKEPRLALDQQQDEDLFIQFGISLGVSFGQGLSVVVTMTGVSSESQMEGDDQLPDFPYLRDDQGQPVLHFPFENRFAYDDAGNPFLHMTYVGSPVPLIEMLVIEVPTTLPAFLSEFFGEEGRIQFQPGDYPLMYGGFWIPVKVLDTTIQVDVDVKPGSDTNPINLKSKGVIPVAILTTTAFDATTVDPLSVAFGPNGAMEAHGKGHIEDADDDGDLDMVLHFRTQQTGIACGDTEAALTGETVGGQQIEGSDTIQTLGCSAGKTLAGAEAAENVAEHFALDQNYPNPFNPTTEIRFGLPDAVHVQLVVYNVMGREVARLVNQPMGAGTHGVTWDASGLPSGTYFYQLTAGSFIETRQMTLLK